MIDWGTIRCLLEWVSLPNWESGNLFTMTKGLLARLPRGSVSFRGDFGSGLCFYGLGPRPHTCGLGAGLNIYYFIRCCPLFGLSYHFACQSIQFIINVLHHFTHMLLLFSHSVVSNPLTPWTVAYQVPLSMEFSRQEYWSGCHAVL